jgi:hypothetical protein
MSRQAAKQLRGVDDLGDESDESNETDAVNAAIDESDAYFAAGNEGIPADVVLAEVRQILRG